MRSCCILYQKQPNPFKDKTQIKYKLFEQADVSIKVYNSLGIMVRSLINNTKDKGTYMIELNTKKLNRGIYYYVLEINNKPADTKKMIIIK